MESVAVNAFGDAYRGRRVLLTGHTGFKGSWLALWLHELGARVDGIALAPTTNPSHWALLQQHGKVNQINDHRLDLRDALATASAFTAFEPEIVFHLAAQPLVRRSYLDPLETWSTNVMGTVNVLEACRGLASAPAIVIVTSDKCYENRGTPQRYIEDDRLGGHDPYSASKAAVEIAAASYRSAFFEHGPLLATARAGNVIGGGDWSEDRLIPDLVRAAGSGGPLEIRSPAATRPWQHVLESLAGYLALGTKLLAGERQSASAWNFGPREGDDASVAAVLAQMRKHWPELLWRESTAIHPHEAALLHVDSSKAEARLGWRGVWNLDAALEATAVWYRSFLESGIVVSSEQLRDYVRDAGVAGVQWAR